VWLIPTAGIFFFLWRLKSKPRYHQGIPFDQLNHLVERFVRTQKAGGVMLMERENGAGLLQLKLRRVDENDVTVEIGIPEVDWSMDEFDGIEVQLGDAGFATRIGGGRGCSTVRRFLRASTSGEKGAVVSSVTRGIGVVGASLGWQTSRFTVHYEVSWRSRIE
jgi:hypothetical protein